MQELYVAQVVQSPRQGSSDWRYVGGGWTDYRSGPAVQLRRHLMRRLYRLEERVGGGGSAANLTRNSWCSEGRGRLWWWSQRGGLRVRCELSMGMVLIANACRLQSLTENCERLQSAIDLPREL